MGRSRVFGRTKTISVLVLYVAAIALVAVARFLGVETREDAQEFAELVFIPLSSLVLLGAIVIFFRRSKNRKPDRKSPKGSTK